MCKNQWSNLGLICVASAMLASSAQSAALKWRGGAGEEPFLMVGTMEVESDSDMFARCTGAGGVEVRLGANLKKIKKEGRAIVFTARNGADGPARVEGKTTIQEMTGSMEALASLRTDHPLFALLAQGRAVTVERPGHTPMRWPAAGMKAATQRFVAACAKMKRQD